MTTVLKLNYVTVYTMMMVALTVVSLGFIFRLALRPHRPARHHDLGLRAGGDHLLAGLHLARRLPDNPVMLTILALYLVILVTMVYGPIAAFLVELFPARIRYSSDGVAAIGIAVSLGFMREPTHKIRIWDEVGGGAPPLVPDQP
jgi:hypothetical protein